MNNVLKLAYNMTDCHPSWRNFFDSRCRDMPEDEFGDVKLSELNNELQKWNAVYIESTVVFNSDSDLNWFLLSWS